MNGDALAILSIVYYDNAAWLVVNAFNDKVFLMAYLLVIRNLENDDAAGVKKNLMVIFMKVILKMIKKMIQMDLFMIVLLIMKMRYLMIKK